MKPIDFPGRNVVFAKDQPQYRALFAHRTVEGRVTSCWTLTWGERLAMLWRGRFWLSVLTFNSPPQPVLPSVDPPIDELCP